MGSLRGLERRVTDSVRKNYCSGTEDRVTDSSGLGAQAMSSMLQLLAFGV